MEIKKPVENVLEETLKNLKTIVDIDCVVGDAITKDDKIIIPICKVTVGFLSGGGEYENNKKTKLTYPFAGGSGGGCNITPIGFLVVIKDRVEFLKITPENNIEKLIDIINNFISSKK